LLETVAVVKSSPAAEQQREDVYEETTKIEADMTFSKQLEAHTAQGIRLVLFCAFLPRDAMLARY